MLGGVLSAQSTDDDKTRTAVCSFDDGKQMSVRYNAVMKENPPTGKAWMPGGAAMTLFTETETALGGRSIPTGGYTMYLVPGKRDWTLIVSRNVDVAAKYDPAKDLAHATMETGTLSQPVHQLNLYFGHTGPKVCEINLEYGKTRAWVDFTEK